MSTPEMRGPLLDAAFLRRLERLAIAVRRAQAGRAKGERQSRRKGGSVEFADYRDYVQGDDLRHLDWNLYARLDETYIKLFHEQEELTIHLIVDTSRSMAFGNPPKLLTAAQIAAALGYVALCSYDRVAIEGVGGATQRLAPCRGKASARRLLAFMNDIEADLETALRTYVLRTRARGVAVLVSDLFDEAGFEAAVKRMQAPGIQGCVVHVMAREELEPDVSGDLRLLDSETGAHTDISASPALLARYRRNVQAFCDNARATCVARGVPYVFATNDAPVDRVVLDAMRRAGIVR